MTAAVGESRTDTAWHREGSVLWRSYYECTRWALTLILSLRGGLRVTGRAHLPRSGGALILANHASFLDPVVVGISIPQPIRYVARATLFKPFLGPYLRSLGAFPIDREGGGTAGLRETLRELKAGQVVLIFPEGTRSSDGSVGPLKPGFAAMTRARVPIVPAAIAGTFEAMPRGGHWPRPHPIRVHFDAPILPEEYADLEPDALTNLIRGRLQKALNLARAGLDRGLRGPL